MPITDDAHRRLQFIVHMHVAATTLIWAIDICEGGDARTAMRQLRQLAKRYCGVRRFRFWEVCEGLIGVRRLTDAGVEYREAQEQTDDMRRKTRRVAVTEFVTK